MSHLLEFKSQEQERLGKEHAELEANTKNILDEVHSLHEKKANLHPGVDDQQIGAIDKRLGELQQSFTDLYHPSKNPGALAHVGHFIKQHILRKKQPSVPATPAQAKAKFSWNGGAADTAGPEVNPYAEQARQMKAAGFTDEQIKKAQDIASGIEAKPIALRGSYTREDGTSADGKPMSVWRNKADPSDALDSTGQQVDPEILKGFKPTPKEGAGGHSKFNEEAQVYEQEWGKKLADWTPDQLSYFNQKMAYDSARAGESTTTRLEKDEQGNIHPVEITSSHGPTSPPVENPAWRKSDPNAPAVPKTPGEAKKRVSAAATPHSKVREGAPLSFQAGTPATNKAQSDVVEATKLSSIADQVAQKPDDAINQKRLAVALERASAGRFTTQALDYIIKAGWGNTIEQWANNPSTGALPADVMRQLVDGAHQNLKAAQDALAAAKGGTSGGANEIHYKIVNGQLVAQ